MAVRSQTRGARTPSRRSDGPESNRPPRVLFAMEQHLGHRTYYENLRTQADREDVETIWVPIDYARDGWLARLPFPASVRSAASARRTVRAAVRQADADAHVFNTQVPAVLGGRRARSRPYVIVTDVTPRQYDRIADGYAHRADRPGLRRWWKHRANVQTFAGASWCVGWSRWACDSMVSDYGVDPGRIKVVPPGVDTEHWRPGAPRDDGVRLLFVGGDFARKGGDQLLRAFAALPDDAELTVVTRSSVPRHDRVTVVDDLGPNDPRLRELFRSSDIFVLPSLAETFGIAAAEAAASGLPVVATALGGLPEIVDDGTTGLIVGPGDVAALTVAVRSLYDDAGRRQRMGLAARARAVERFDAHTNARLVVDLALAAARR